MVFARMCLCLRGGYAAAIGDVGRGLQYICSRRLNRDGYGYTVYHEYFICWCLELALPFHSYDRTIAELCS